MTSTSEITGAADGEIFKTDTAGRVRVPRARREALLDEFERSGASGAQFAAYVGVKYSTFAAWAHKRRRQTALAQAGAASEEPAKQAAAPMRWWETVLEGEPKPSRARPKSCRCVCREARSCTSPTAPKRPWRRCCWNSWAGSEPRDVKL